MMSITEDIFDLFNLLEQNGGWFFEFLSYFIATGLVLIAIIYFRRLWTGEIGWLGGGQEEEGEADATQIEIYQKMVEDLEGRIDEISSKNESLKKEIEKKKETIRDMMVKTRELKMIYEELDAKYEDETYTTSQILYTAEEVAYSLTDGDNFLENRHDIYMNIFDYLINTVNDSRENHARVVIHVPDPENEGFLTHFAHSSSHSHRVREYQPPIYGSAAGCAWRTNTLYYVPDVNDRPFEYDPKANPIHQYHTLFCVPLNAGPEISTRIGVLSITGKSIDAYEEMERERIVLFSKLLYPLVYFDLEKRGGSNSG